MSLKMLREELCRRRTQAPWPRDVKTAVDDLIRLIDYFRPLGVDGKHGDRHTADCGCEDQASRVEACCVVMHDAYEEAAVQAGWSTQAASRKPWAEVPEANKATMRAAVGALLAYLTPAAAPPWPDCPRHSETQHRDGKPPWCNDCGWNRGRPATSAWHQETIAGLGRCKDPTCTDPTPHTRGRHK